MSSNKEILLVNRPNDGKIGPHLFETREQSIPTPGEGEILIKQTYMSLDPAMLGWMSEDRESYIPPVELGEVMRSSGVGEVIESNNPDFSVGDKVMGMTGWREYLVSNGEGFNKLQSGITEEMALCVFALPGLTATTGLYNFGEPKEGETLVVTGAAGSVGSIVGQLAKADGLRVIGVVGSDEKADWIVNELGFDGAVNYKTDDLEAKLTELTPDKIDVFFENTGGPIQHHIVNRMNTHGRIVVCGMIADYQSENPAPGPNWIPLIKKRINIRGFAMPDHWGEVPQLVAKLSPYVQQGKIQYRSHMVDGIESAVDGLKMLFSGDNKGKMIVKL
ncbi:NADP-dependent oxidoreductase [Alteromonas sp. CI.11.F.A3]|uniref:NADP-dependent oxidoreductase n=1 Tax=Alteromonas sp. CI.11.F.A3 TaxID=3079555 RepID=UPI002941E3A7|nr:NADP-dependent oxidoreductase [Alteromonas sp. CI.11.F.A3]WOI37803.1 NADP-dependent oxidoreductase [Alteromonas sp. CI.11.F.A3]